MKIFKISQSVNTGYDTYSDAVVIAENEEDAKKIHPNGHNKETLEVPSELDRHYGSWCALKEVEVEYIGEAKPGSKRGIVCASFHAG